MNVQILNVHTVPCERSDVKRSHDRDRLGERLESERSPRILCERSDFERSHATDK